MPKIFRILGRLTGRAMRSHAFDRALTVTAGYFLSEMRLVDIKAKRTLIRRKYTNHLRLLGKTVYRLKQNDIDPGHNSHVTTIVQVLNEIKQELELVEAELVRRRAKERAANEHRKQTDRQGKNRTC